MKPKLHPDEADVKGKVMTEDIQQDAYRMLRGVSAIVAVACMLQTAAVQARPNVVLILADDLGWVDTSFTGSKLYRTPNIERLAKRGVYFPNAYAASPLCSPTRASIMTGQSPARCGITAPVCHTGGELLKAGAQSTAKPTERQTNCSSATRLSTEHDTLAEALKDAGYATGHFGKWHLGREPYSPLEHGFDVDVPHWPGPGPAGSFVAPWKFPNFKERTPGEHIEDRMGDEAVAFMETNRNTPFFLNYWQFSVHAPFNAKQALIDQYKQQVHAEDPQQSPTYAAMVHSLDDNVGKILDALERLGIADKTIVIFYSDNGGNMYNMVDGDLTATSNAPLRGGKASMYEGGIRVPAIVSWPGVTEGGTTSDALVQSEDLYPTILEMADVPVKAEQAHDALSMVPALRGEKPLRDAVYCYFPHGPNVPDWMPPSVCVRRGDWKLIRVFHDAPDQAHRYELYNLKEDIGERRNLAGRHSERVRDLDALLDTFLADTGAVLPQPNPTYDPKAVESAGGWSVSGAARVGLRWGVLQLRSFGSDAVLTADAPLGVKPGRHVLELRMRSWSAGPARVEWSAAGKRTASATFEPRSDGLWHNYEVELPFSAAVDTVRFAPCTMQGTVQIAWIRLRDSAGNVVKEWDLSTPAPKPKRGPKPKPQPVVGGWRAGPNGYATSSLKDGILQLKTTAGDPMLMTVKPLDAPAGNYTFTMRMRAQAKGGGQVFCRPAERGYEPGTGTAFRVTHDGEWHDYTIRLDRDHPVREIRLDPCAAPGKVEIDWIRLNAADGRPISEWTFNASSE